ncbi:MAG: pyruvate dehydrogenase complex dihydrolipoamide acetyltransferase [Bacteroidota bacterium]|nr:pyruvate dehydrogenase complex dihydrolipoamide acetyltransferase [Bacteroidota bacterium]
MAEIVTMPRLSDTMTEGVVAKWHKKIGDKVEEGDLLADIETDKATMEFEAFQEGELLYIGVDEGESAPVDAILAILGKKGEDIDALIKKHQSGDSEKDESSASESRDEEKEEDKAEEKTEQTKSTSGSSTTNNGRVKASPLAKKMAEDKGIDLDQIQGSGDGGRIVKRDIENYTPSSAPATLGVDTSYEDVPVSQMRKTIARRLAESKFTAPHFYLTMQINMDEVVKARKAIIEKTGEKVSFNDIVVKATALALKKHPKVNASWLGDKIRYYNYVNMGIAVAVDEGLLVPVVRHADAKGLLQIAQEVREFAQKAKDKKLQPSDWEGNTFTISNLGMFGIDEFTAIINPPDACILAVGGIQETPVVKDGEVSVSSIMKVTLSCDHRVVDGALGAAFLQTLKNNLENPLYMLV